MNRLILYAALTLLSVPGKVFAQEEDSVKVYVFGKEKVIDFDRLLFVKPEKKTKTESTFNTDESYILNRHTVLLPKNEKMVIEMSDLHDYQMLKNLDSILSDLRNDIEFYKDSLNVLGNVRIDYKISREYPEMKPPQHYSEDMSGGGKYPRDLYYKIANSSIKTYKEIRFKKYPPDGDIYIRQHSDISRLKLEQDTVRIILIKNLHRTSGPPQFYDFPVQVTFCLNNYTDIDGLIRDKEMLHHIIDTLTEASLPGKKATIRNTQSTIEYRPYEQGVSVSRYKKVNIILPPDENIWDLNVHSNKAINILFNVGAGLVRNTLAPTAEIYTEYQANWKYNQFYQPDKYSVKSYTFYRLSVAPYFFFTKTADGNNIVNDNWFVNAEIGNHHERLNGDDGRNSSFGIGYLFATKGGYFQNLTMKMFTKIDLSKHIIVSPELIFTNNFKQIFPGITLQVSLVD